MPILHSTDRRGHPNVFRCDADADILRSMGPSGQTKQRRAAPPAKVLVRPPGPSFRLALSEHPERDRLDPERAARQHAGFVAALRGHGADVVNLPEVADLPDATFVSDTVLVLPPASSPEGPPGLVVFTRPGAETRRAEVEAIARPVRSLVQPGTLEVTVKEPGTLEGGDVIVFGDHLAIGLSARNQPRRCGAAGRGGVGVRLPAVPVSGPGPAAPRVGGDRPGSEPPGRHGRGVRIAGRVRGR